MGLNNINHCLVSQISFEETRLAAEHMTVQIWASAREWSPLGYGSPQGLLTAPDLAVPKWTGTNWDPSDPIRPDQFFSG